MKIVRLIIKLISGISLKSILKIAGIVLLLIVLYVSYSKIVQFILEKDELRQKVEFLTTEKDVIKNEMEELKIKSNAIINSIKTQSEETEKRLLNEREYFNKTFQEHKIGLKEMLAKHPKLVEKAADGNLKNLLSCIGQATTGTSSDKRCP